MGDTDCYAVRLAAPWSWWGEAQACPAAEKVPTDGILYGRSSQRRWQLAGAPVDNTPAAWATRSNLICLLRHRFGSQLASGSSIGAVAGVQAHSVRERGLCWQSSHLDSEPA